MKHLSNWRLLVAPVAVTAIALAACGSDNSGSSAATTAGTSAATTAAASTAATTGGAATTSSATTAAPTTTGAPLPRITMKIATVTPNGADTSPLIIGKEKGIFDQCGIDLEFASFNTNPDVIRSSTSGATNLSGAGPAGAITAMIAGQDLSIVSGAYQTSSHTTWVVSPDSPIKTVKDLAGKKIGVASPGGPTEAEIRYVLEKEGIDPNSAQYVVVGAIQAGIAAMAAGQVDSTYTGDPTLPTLLAQNPPIVRPLVSVDDYVRTQSTVYVGTTDWVTSHKAEVDRFLACVAKAQDYVKKNVEEAAQIYAKVGNIDPTVALAVLKYAVSKDAFSLAISDEGIDFTINQLKLAKAIPQDFTKAQLAPLLKNLRPA